MIIIVDYQMGNVGSILNMFRRIVGANVQISSDPSVIGQAEKLILPGVGAFDTGMRNIAETKLLPVLEQKALKERVPILGICLGMQLMTESSEEGQLKGLGWFKAKTVRFNVQKLGPKLRIPHMGWNFIKKAKDSHLLTGIDENSRFYFVHSYHVVCDNQGDVIATTNHGYDFVSIFQKDNISGVQFHPEKSHKFGMCLLRNFTAS